MVYCMSDVHGEYERYKKMLEYINFSDEDTLFVIGDVIDRHPGGIDVLMDIMRRSNVHMILGNHEQMLLDTFANEPMLGARELWWQNGGEPTYVDMLFCRTEAECLQVIAFLKGLPDHMDIEVNGNKFHLVHGLPTENHYTRLWNRPDKDTEMYLEATVIVGHTPTILLNEEIDGEEEPFRIWYGTGIIDIDCGCGHQMKERRLACLRLDDMKEFYV